MKPRYCALGITPPSVKILGKEYGVCPLSSPCPDEVVCGYALTRRHIEESTKPVTNGERK
jgi:hypothetical protein